jgi:hypothetical protein
LISKDFGIYAADARLIKEPMTATLRGRLNRSSGLSQYSVLTGTKISLSKTSDEKPLTGHKLSLYLNEDGRSKPVKAYPEFLIRQLDGNKHDVDTMSQTVS